MRLHTGGTGARAARVGRRLAAARCALAIAVGLAGAACGPSGGSATGDAGEGGLVELDGARGGDAGGSDAAGGGSDAADARGDATPDAAEGGVDGGSLNCSAGFWYAGAAWPKLPGIAGAPQALVDLDGDGATDVVVPLVTGDLAVALGTKGGPVGPARVVRTWLELESMATGDLNGDGHPDVAAIGVQGRTRSLGVLFGDGHGGLAAPVVTALPSTAGHVVVADFDGDGKLDVAVAAIDDKRGGVEVLRGAGDGTFAPPVFSSSHTRPDSLAAADLNGDGLADIAGSVPYGDTPTGADYGFVMLSSGGGVLGKAMLLDYGTYVAIADLNGDGKPDLAFGEPAVGLLCCAHGDGVEVLLGRGDGTFPSHAFYRTDSPLPAIADVDGDGLPDLVTPLDTLLGTGSGRFAAAVHHFSPRRATSVGVADVTGDGAPDLVSAYEDSLAIAAGHGDGTFALPPRVAVSFEEEYAPRIVAGDFDGDGKRDVALASTGAVTALLGKGDGSFAAPLESKGTKYPDDLLAVDLDGDGQDDLVLSSLGVGVQMSHGGQFGALTEYSAPDGADGSNAMVADLDGDGVLDLAQSVYDWHNGTALVAFFKGHGDGTFASPVESPLWKSKEEPPAGAALGDMNGDGKLDVIVPQRAAATVYVALGHGDGTFAAASPFTTPAPAEAVLVEDANGDGHEDVILTGTPGAGVGVMFGDGKGGLAPAQVSLDGIRIEHALLADVDGDGIRDLVGNVGSYGSLVVAFGTQAGTFVASASFPAASWPAVADFNGDGRPDVAGVIHGLASVSIGLNGGCW